MDAPLQLETARLLLRSLTLEDADFILAHFSDPAVTEHLLDAEPLKDRAEAEDLIRFFEHPAGKGYHRWGIVRKDDGRLIGTCGFHKLVRSQNRVEIGYDLTPSEWAQGLMAEALRAVLGYLFDTLAVHRVEALVYVGNPRSAALLEKLGFHQEGRLRDYFYLRGAYYDHFIYSLLKTDNG